VVFPLLAEDYTLMHIDKTPTKPHSANWYLFLFKYFVINAARG